MADYTDEHITFFMGIYRDLDRASGALSRLREHFPAARVIVRSDGDRDPRNRELSEQFDVEYLEEKRLYPIKNGGAMIARTLELLLDRPARFYFKIDTDTATYRRFHYLPERTGVFGSVHTSRVHGCTQIQGGCVGFTENAARAISNSGLLRDPRLKKPLRYRFESPYFARMAGRVKRTGLCSFDWIVGWAANELQIPMFSFDEVHCRGEVRHAANNEDLRYALTHPVYFA